MTITDSDKAHLATLPAELRAAIHGMLDRAYREGLRDAAGPIGQVVRKSLEACAEGIERAAGAGR
jgi:hypothetical protein